MIIRISNGKIDLLMVDLMKNATVQESNCNCFPVHPLKIKLTRLLFHFLLALHFAHIRVFIFRPFRIYEGVQCVNNTSDLLSCLGNGNTKCVRTLPRHWFAVQFLLLIFRSIFPPIGIVWWRVLLAILESSLSRLPTNCTILAFVLRANVTYVSSSRLFSYQQKTNKW